MGTEICSSPLGRTRLTTLYVLGNCPFGESPFPNYRSSHYPLVMVTLIKDCYKKMTRHKKLGKIQMMMTRQNPPREPKDISINLVQHQGSLASDHNLIFTIELDS